MDDLILTGAYYQHFLKSAQFPYTAEERTCIQSTVAKLDRFKTKGDH